MAAVRKGDRVQVHFTGRLPDGTVFQTSEGDDPLEFEAGSDEVIAGLSQAVIGMKEGEQKRVSIPPEEAFGERHEDRVQEVPRSALPKTVKEGDRLEADTGDAVIPVWVKKLEEETATVDANHPLAGETLEIDLKLVSVEPAA